MYWKFGGTRSGNLVSNSVIYRTIIHNLVTLPLFLGKEKKIGLMLSPSAWFADLSLGVEGVFRPRNYRHAELPLQLDAIR